MRINRKFINSKIISQKKLIVTLVYTVVIVSFGMSLFELLKRILFSSLDLKQSNLITIIFSVIASVVVAFFIYVKQDKINKQLLEEIEKRKDTEKYLNHLNRIYSVLSHMNQSIVRIKEKQKLYDETCRIIIEHGKFRMVWIGEVELDSGLVKPVANYGLVNGYLDHLVISLKNKKQKEGPTGSAIRKGKYFICNDIAIDKRMEPWRDKALKLDFHSSAAFPIILDNENIIGSINVYSSEVNFFKEEEIKLFSEISQNLSFALEMMASEYRREKAETELRTTSNYVRSLIEASLDPLVTISPEGKIIDVNEATVKATGTVRDVLIGDDFSNYFTEPDKASEGYKKVLSKGLIKDYPLSIRNKSGKTMDVLYNATVYKNNDGEIQGVFAAARDITEHKRAEKTLQKLLADLQHSNEELEQFAYAASHDLQEPLRMISSYTQLLEKRYKDKLDDDANDFINFAVDGANRMQRLINDLLQYSRITTRGKLLAKVDLSAVLKQSIKNLQHKISETKAVIDSDILPSVYGDETQLIRVFQNLIDNALKFIGNESPRIIIKSIDEDERVIISISDNGIGMDPKYKDKIFLLFQRLHSKNDFPGTGIGLSICKRIIERHGGKIWFESQVGKGTTFYFTLNK